MRDMSTLDKASIPRRQFGNLNLNTTSPKKKRNFKKFLPKVPHVSIANKKRAGVITAIVAVVVIGGGGFGYYEYLQSQNPAVIYAKKLQTLTDSVGKQMTLPTDEKPVIATVSDIKSLPKETFFENAQEGDKILMYKKHKLAVLYRPTTGNVVTYATLEFKDIPTPAPEVAGASTSAQIATASAVIIGVTPGPTVPYTPQGKILVRPQ